MSFLDQRRHLHHCPQGLLQSPLSAILRTFRRPVQRTGSTGWIIRKNMVYSHRSFPISGTSDNTDVILQAQSAPSLSSDRLLLSLMIPTWPWRCWKRALQNTPLDPIFPSQSCMFPQLIYPSVATKATNLHTKVRMGQDTWSSPLQQPVSRLPKSHVP